jgi:four helix bundle protein
MKGNVVMNKSFEFAVKIVKLVKSIQDQKKEYLITKQLIRSGTSIGANIREGNNGESKADFIHKLSIAQKECSETIYWLDLLKETEYITKEQFNSVQPDAIELIKLLTSILKTTKYTINN